VKQAANQGDFDDPRGLYGSTEDVTFGSPISMSQIVFAAITGLAGTVTGIFVGQRN